MRVSRGTWRGRHRAGHGAPVGGSSAGTGARCNAGRVVSSGVAGSAAALRAGFEPAAAGLGSRLDLEQGPVADALAVLGAELTTPPRWHWRARSPRRPRGLYVHGPVGAGKTWLVDVLLSQLPDPLYRRVHVYQAARALHAGVAARAGQPGALDGAVAGLLDGAQLLFLDELHAHDPGDAMILSRMLLALPAYGAVLVATSNYPPTGLLPDPRHHRLVLPLVSAIEASCQVLELDAGIDHRAAGHGGARRGFSAGAWASPGSHAQLASLGLSAPEPGDRTCLTVGGRPLWTTSASDGVLQLRFDELCQRPTSVGDMLALTERYATLVLAAVPPLASVDEYARRRFADLVDVAWDRDTRLVVLTAHPLEQVLDAETTDRDATMPVRSFL